VVNRNCPVAFLIAFPGIWLICFLQWFDRHDQVCKIEPMKALVATTCDALQQALCKIYDRGAIRTTCRTSRPMSKSSAACSRVRSNGSPGFRTPVRSTSTRTARRAPTFGHGPAMTLGKARRTPHCELRRHAGRRVRRSSLRDQVLVRAELGRAEPRPHRPPRQIEQGDNPQEQAARASHVARFGLRNRADPRGNLARVPGQVGDYSTAPRGLMRLGRMAPTRPCSGR